MDIVIKSEEDAWEWLKKAVEGEIDQGEPLTIEFDGWPKLDLKFTGNDFHSSVPTRIMPPIVAAQIELHRVLGQLKYGHPNARRLTQVEREKMELNVKVLEGSSKYEVNLPEVLTELGKVALNNMNSKHIVITILGLALTWGGSVSWKHWLDTRLKEKEMEVQQIVEQERLKTQVQMSQIEKQKLKLFNEAKIQAPEIRRFEEGADEFRNDSLNKLKPNDRFQGISNDVQIDGRTAAEITQSSREPSEVVRLDGEFLILRVDSGETKGFRIKAKRILDNKELRISIPDELVTEKLKRTLRKNEWEKTPVILEVDARLLRGEYTSATLINAKDVAAPQEE